MKIRKLIVKNFRGIQKLEWEIYTDMVCLVGPGDSTKSTILLAMEYLFWPNWFLQISDIDFFKLNVDELIEISAIITDPPSTLVTEEKYGLFLGFWNPIDKVHEEQKDDQDQKALQIQLKVTKDIEPEWNIVSLQKDGKEPQRISANDRRLLGVARIGNFIENDLSWGRNSALMRITQKDNLEKIPSLLVDAERQIIANLKKLDFSALDDVINLIGNNARSFGMNNQDCLKASMDPARISLRQGAIALFDGELPIALRGEGSRRLLVMAAHKIAVREGAIILIDEIENCLEPYRLRHLIRQLRPKSKENHQVVFSTHSPITIEENDAQEIYVVQSNEGVTTIVNVDEDLQKIVRSIPEALLSKRIIVCEGKTESGFLISLDQEYWQKKHEQSPMEHRYSCLAEAGVMPIEISKSGGTEAPKYAAELAMLGYAVAYLGDSDTSLQPSETDLKDMGINVVLWEKGEKGVSIEERLCLDLPVDGLQKLIELAIELEVEECETLANACDKVWDRIINKIYNKTNKKITERNVEKIIQTIEIKLFRELLGEAAKGKRKTETGWFKRKDKGAALGTLVAKYLDEMEDTPTMMNLKTLENWCYE